MRILRLIDRETTYVVIGAAALGSALMLTALVAGLDSSTAFGVVSVIVVYDIVTGFASRFERWSRMRRIRAQIMREIVGHG